MRIVFAIILIASLALAAAAVAAAVCEDDPARILRESVAAMREVDSFHFEETYGRWKDREWLLNGSVDGWSFEAGGEFASPDRMRKRARFHAPGMDVAQVEAIRIGDSAYVTGPGAGKWTHADTAAAAGWHSHHLWRQPIAFMEGVVSGLGPDLEVDVMTVDGVELYHVTGRTFRYEYPAKAIRSQAEFWVGVDDLLVREFVVTDDLTTGCPDTDVACPGILYEDSTSSITFRFTDYGKAVSIRAPSEEETAKVDTG